MTIESQVCSLELAKRLKELGVPQTSQFYWSETQIPNIDYVLRYEPDIRLVKGTMFASAYLASELGEMLPLKYASYRFSVKQTNEVDWCCDDNKGDVSMYADTECNARAKMLIHLLENHLISVKELGK